MPSNLEDFDLAEMLRCSVGLRRVMRDAPTMETAAREACRFLYGELVTAADEPACALIRCYKTHRYGDLEPSLQSFARKQLAVGIAVRPDMRCLTLLATAGTEPDWNDRRLSKGHQAIPLPTALMVERAPMVAQLFRAFGLDLTTAIAPSAEIVRDLAGKTYGVFHVPEASGSPYIPAQDFVKRSGIRSVIGFGGAVATGDQFAIILFTRALVSEAVADRFRTLALDVKSCFFLYGPGQVFDRSAFP